jgi:hypothetical protein
VIFWAKKILALFSGKYFAIFIFEEPCALAAQTTKLQVCLVSYAQSFNTIPTPA